MDRLLRRVMRAREIESDLGLELVAVNLSAAVRRAIDQVAAAATDKRITVRAALDRDLVVASDDLVLAEILDNLLTNAIKYTPPGGIVLVTAGLTDDNPDTVELLVADDGVGIAADEIGLLFKKFSRAQARPTAQEDSVGLGLYAVSVLCAQVGARCSISSPGLGRGTTARVLLPRPALVGQGARS